MPFLIDAHEDLAFNALSFHRDYRKSAQEIRQSEIGTPVPALTGDATLGWPDYQRGQVALIFPSLFIVPKKHNKGAWTSQVFDDSTGAYRLYQGQFDYYHRLAEEHPDEFRLVRTQKDLTAVLAPWEARPANPPETTHPVGLVLLMEGGEGLPSFSVLEEWWDLGLRIFGPVWAGTRWCGGTFEKGGFTGEGRELLDVLGSLGFVLDLSHMTEESTLEALDRYEGTVIATHANARSLVQGSDSERHFSDATIRRLIERGGVMGVIPYNRFLLRDWKVGDPREQITLDHLAAHIDHICQIAGNPLHAAIGSDFDGGFGWPSIPYEIDTISDLQKLESQLIQRGYRQDDVQLIFNGNWQRMLTIGLPRS